MLTDRFPQDILEKYELYYPEENYDRYGYGMVFMTEEPLNIEPYRDDVAVIAQQDLLALDMWVVLWTFPVLYLGRSYPRIKRRQ